MRLSRNVELRVGGGEGRDTMKLTPEQIHAMSAGPAMNAAVAETVMGWTRYPKEMHPNDNRTIDGVLYCPPDAPWDMNARNVVPDYSGDIACAFEMQAEIARRDLWVSTLN